MEEKKTGTGYIYICKGKPAYGEEWEEAKVAAYITKEMEGIAYFNGGEICDYQGGIHFMVIRKVCVEGRHLGLMQEGIPTENPRITETRFERL